MNPAPAPAPTPTPPESGPPAPAARPSTAAPESRPESEPAPAAEPEPTPAPPPPLPTPEQAFRRLRWRVLAWRALALGFAGLGLIGLALPVMPTAPFMLAAAWAAGRGWPAFERWLLDHAHFGPPIRQWRERGAIDRRAKWLATAMMATSACAMQFVAAVPLWLRIAVPALMAAVALWMWARPDA